jgi:uncharacterized membrane protein YfcA
VLPVVLIALGFAGALLSGLVGVGGAIVMIPLLLFVPPALGLEDLGIATVAGITMVQVVAAALSGLVGHRGRIDRPLLIALGPSMVVASFAGGFASGFVAPIVLKAVFAAVASLAAVMMLVLRDRTPAEADGRVAFNRRAAIAAAAGVGFSAGLVGAGGAFFLVPVMLYGLRVPVRIAVATSLAVVAAAGLAGLAGKVAANQVDWFLAGLLVIGALPGARLGATISGRVSTVRCSAPSAWSSCLSPSGCGSRCSPANRA